MKNYLSKYFVLCLHVSLFYFQSRLEEQICKVLDVVPECLSIYCAFQKTRFLFHLSFTSYLYLLRAFYIAFSAMSFFNDKLLYTTWIHSLQQKSAPNFNREITNSFRNNSIKKLQFLPSLPHQFVIIFNVYFELKMVQNLSSQSCF